MLARLWNMLARPERLYYVLGESSNGVILVIFLVAARLVPVEDYGVFVAILAAGNIVGQIGQLGVPDLVMRSIARESGTTRHEFFGGLRLQLAAAPIVLAAIYIYMRVADFDGRHLAAGLMLGASIALRSIKRTFRSTFQGAERFDLDASTNWVERGTTLLLVAALCATVLPNLNGIAIGYLVARLLDLLIFFVVAARLLPPATQPSESHATVFRRALPFATAGLLWAFYYHVDLAMLPLLNTQTETALYGSAYRFVDLFLMIPRLLVVVEYPRLVSTWQERNPRFYRLEGRIRSSLLVVTFPVLIILAVFATPLLRLAFGPVFAEAGPTLTILAVGCFFAAQSQVGLQLLKATGGERLLTPLYLVTVAVNIGLNIMLIPRLGARGAAIATACTEVLLAVALGILLKVSLKQRARLASPAFLVAATTLGIITLAGDRLPIPLACALGVAGWIPAVVRMISQARSPAENANTDPSAIQPDRHS